MPELQTLMTGIDVFLFDNGGLVWLAVLGASAVLAVAGAGQFAGDD